MAAPIDLPDLRGTLRIDLRDLQTLPGRVRETIRRAQAAARGDPVRVPVDVDADGTVREVRDAERRAQAAASANPVRIPVEVDRSTLDRLGQGIRNLRTVFGTATGPVTGLTGALAGMARTTTLVTVAAGGLSAALVGAVGLVGQTVALAAAATQAAAAWPLLVTAAAAGGAVFGTLALAASGVADGLKLVTDQTAKLAAGQKLTKGETAKLDAALKGLAPSARAFVLQVGELLPKLRAVQQAVQQRFFAGFAADTERLATVLLPRLSRAGRDLATTLNSTVRTALASLTVPSSLTALDVILRSTTTAAAALGPVLGRIPAVLLRVGAAGAPALTRLAQIASDALGQALDNLTGAAASGDLAIALEGAVGVLVDLGRLALSVFGVIKGISDAATTAFGSNLTTPLAAAAKAMSDFVNSAPGQDFLTGVFATAAPVLGQIGGLLKELGPILAELFPVVAQLAGAFLSGLAPVLPVLGGLLEAVGRALALLLPFLSQAAQIIGGALTAAVSALAPQLPVIADAFVQLVTALSPALPVIAGALGAALAVLAPQLPIVAQAIADLAVALAPSLPVLAQALADALIAIAPELPGLAAAFGGLAAALIPLVREILPLLPGLVTVLTFLVQALTITASVANFVAAGILIAAAAMSAMQHPAEQIAAKLAGLNTALRVLSLQGVAQFAAGLSTMPARAAVAVGTVAGRVIATVGPTVAGVARVAAQAVVAAAGALARMPGAAGAAVAATTARVVGAISATPARAAAVAASAVVRFAAALAPMAARAAAVVSGVARAITGALAGVAGAAFGAAANIVSSIVAGLRSRLGEVVSVAHAIAGAIRNVLPFSPVREGPLRALNSAATNPGGKITRIIAEGMLSEVRRVTAAANAVAGAASLAGLGGAQTAAQTAGTASAAGGGTTTVNRGPLLHVEHFHAGGRVDLDLMFDELAFRDRAGQFG